MTQPLTLFHTADVHVETFGALFAALAPEIPLHHLVEAGLLREAEAAGALTVEIRARAAAVLQDAAAGALLVVCTCSTLGPAADDADAAAANPIRRIDRAMAERAVAAGGRVVLAACVPTTLGPTRDLLTATAAAAGRPLELKELLLADAWPLFLAGDRDGYLDRIAAALPAAARDVDAIVLAQASMAGAAARAGDIGVPVLASPRLGVEAAIAAYRAAAT